MKNTFSSFGILVFTATVLITSCASGPSTTTDIRKGEASTIQAQAASIAKRMVGSRYRYGGNNPNKGFDCSGLVHYSYNKAGLRVARSTKTQKRATRSVLASNIRKGDLVFFNQEGKRASHVGIYIGANQFVHAPSSGKRVRIDRLDNPYWRKHWASVRRFNGL
jgi:cell wall-associated NlpC family hydrolase